MTINMSCCMPPTPSNCPMGKSCKSEWMRTVGQSMSTLVLSRLADGAAVTPSPENGGNINDERIGAHFVLYPQPFGFQAEWNWGRGPELNAARTAVEEGYAPRRIRSSHV